MNQWNAAVKNTKPASQPHSSACFQDDLDHNQNRGISANSASHDMPGFGYAKRSTSGLKTETASAYGQNVARSVVRTNSEDSLSTTVLTKKSQSHFTHIACAVALLWIPMLAGCGRGPVEPPILPISAHTITFQLFVNGQINPSQGNYIIAINANENPSTNVNPNEHPGEPTASEAQGNPAPYTHWDQEFVYGSSTTTQPNGFLYAYKVLTGGGGTTNAQFLAIVLNTNNFTLITNGSTGTGNGNVLSITLPIANLSIRGNPKGPNPPTVTSPAATQIYVNYITTDTTGVPQDQLGAQGLSTVGFTQIVDLTTSATIQLPNFSSAPGPSNPNLFISGGQIIVSP